MKTTYKLIDTKNYLLIETVDGEEIGLIAQMYKRTTKVGIVTNAYLVFITENNKEYPINRVGFIEVTLQKEGN